MKALLTLFAVGLLVFLHELGHWLAARLFGVRAVRITFGVGPAIHTWRRRGGLKLVLGAVPLGGSLELQGENPYLADERTQRAGLLAQPAWRRALILGAGPLLNLALAPLMLFLLFLGGTHLPEPLTVGSVDPGSPAALAHLRPGDHVLSVDGRRLGNWSELLASLGGGSAAHQVQVERPEGVASLSLVPTSGVQEEAALGLHQQYVFGRLPPGAAALQALEHTRRILLTEVRDAGVMIRAGPAGFQSALARIRTHQTASLFGLDGVVRILAALSVAVALLHLLPLPPLDGGRLLLALWELRTRRPVKPGLVIAYQALGMLLLLAAGGWAATAVIRQLIAR